MRKNKKTLLLLVIVFVLYRMLVSSFNPPINGEIAHQYRAAEHLRNGEIGMDLRGVPDVLHPPLLTLVATVLGWVFSPDAITKIVFVVCSTLTVLLMSIFVERMYGRTAAYWVWVFWAILPALNNLPLWSQTHSLLLVCLMASIVCFQRILEGRINWGYFLGAGAAGGLAYLARAEGVMYFPLWAAFVILKTRGKQHVASTWPKWFVCIALFLSLVAGRMQHIYHHTGEIALHSDLDRLVIYAPVIEETHIGSWKAESLHGQEYGFINMLWSNKSLFGRRIMGNTRAFFLSLGGLKNLPVFLFLPVGVGLFLSSWSRKQERDLHALLSLSLIPTFAHLLFHIEARYLIPFVMFSLPWLCMGMVQVWRLLGQIRNYSRVSSWLGKSFAIGFLLFVFLVSWTHLFYRQSTAHTECQAAGEWIRQHGTKTATIRASNGVIIFYSGLSASHLSKGDLNQWKNLAAENAIYAAVAKHGSKWQGTKWVFFPEDDAKFIPGESFGQWEYLATTTGKMGKVYIYRWKS